MSVCCVCCVLSGRGLCDELITRPEESYRLWCVVVCDLETSRKRRPWPALGRSATEKKPVVTICTPGLTSTNSASALTEYLFVLCGSENKQPLFPYTALIDWFLWPRPRVFTARYGLDLYLFSCGLTLRRLMSYVYGAPILDVSRSHTTTQHSR